MSPISTYPNFNRRNKWLGIIDYKSLIILLIYVIGIYKIIELLKINVINGIYIILICVVPLLGIMYSNKDEDDIYQSLYIIFKFILSNKRFCYKIDNVLNDEEALNKILNKHKRRRMVQRLMKLRNNASLMRRK